jgi:hypothetical protein
MRLMTMRPGRGDTMSRKLMVDELPRPQTNAQAERVVRDSVAARQRGLLHVSGFGEDTNADTTLAAGGASTSGLMLGSGVGVGRAVMVGVGVTVGAALLLRLLDRVWR